MVKVKQVIPWWSKVLAKLVISRLPISYQFWKKFALIEHGAMEKPSYAYEVFYRHFVQFKQYRESNSLGDRQNSVQEFVSLELGPGDSLFSAIISKSFGGSASYLVDVGDFAARDIQKYRDMTHFLSQKGLPTPDIQNLQSLEKILASCNARYLTSGLSSLKTIPDRSVDFIWSHGVLELIRKAEFIDTLRELRRIIRDDGVCSHLVPLADSLGGLNSLRFPEAIWESDFMAESGFYVNRIRYSQMLNLFRQESFEVEVIEFERWDKLPTPNYKLAKEFRNLQDEELNILCFSVVLKPV